MKNTKRIGRPPKLGEVKSEQYNLRLTPSQKSKLYSLASLKRVTVLELITTTLGL